MKAAILLSAILLSFSANAQIRDDTTYGGTYATINFSKSISRFIIPDTSSIHLWQHGYTVKPIFSPADTVRSFGLMTDTLGYYPVRANNSFILKIDSASPPNMIIEVWHEYQTDSGKDGGVIEFSVDSGLTWTNVISCTNYFPMIATDNIYDTTMKLWNGEFGFTGTSKHQQLSRFQFYDCIPVKPSGTGCHFRPNDAFLIRFRFISDSLADTLSGWKIDSIKVINTGCCCGGVYSVTTAPTIKPYPNPSTDGHFHFNALDDERNYTIAVYNAIGQKLLSIPYTHLVDISHYPNGMYFYNVSNGRETDTGKLLYY
ncbi:MAG: T9SS type A sorting domain-containing protein [Taibaiella sp.]|nr:T9SS type A sorting domain-containing protein [Taibaiella sp.]